MAGGLFAVAVWGASFIATKVALREIRPETVLWLRFVIGVVVLAGAVAVRRQFAAVGPKELGHFALLGFIGITFHQWLQSTALLTSRASTSGWIIAATPVFMALLAWVPLLILSMTEGRAWGDSVALTFLKDIETHLRLLIAVPLLILAEIKVHQRLHQVVSGIVENGLVPDAARAQFDACNLIDPPGISRSIVQGAVKSIINGRTACI